MRMQREYFNETEFQNIVDEQLLEKNNGCTEILWVGDKHRTHPWSMMPGGCTVVVLFKNGACLGYDKVKRPHKYLPKISQEYLCNEYSNYKTNTVEQYIDSIYAIHEGETKLNFVWNKYRGKSPWDLLETYSTK